MRIKFFAFLFEASLLIARKITRILVFRQEGPVLIGTGDDT
jgi:hypothetical protein